jgi:hypothetical protein
VRDNHQGYPEILNVYKRDGSYFGVVRVSVSGDVAAFEFGVDQKGFIALNRISKQDPSTSQPGLRTDISSRGVIRERHSTPSQSRLVFASSKVQWASHSISIALPLWRQTYAGFNL